MQRSNANRHRDVRGVWSVPEHERFIEAMALYPSGPWKVITDHVGTRSIKQVQTHAQKYQQKLMRHQRGLRKCKTKLTRPEHRVDEQTLDQFTHKCIVRYAQRATTKPPTSKALDESAHSEETNTPQSPDSPESDASIGDLGFDGLSVEEWAEMTQDISNDAAFLHLMVDDDAVEPSFETPGPQDWNEWQLDDLLHPLQAR